MITIDPMDDEVVQKKKPERLRTPHERRSPRQPADATPASAEKKHEPKMQSRLVELVLRLLRGVRGEEGTDG